MVNVISDWAPLIVFAAALASPGWGALLAGGLAWALPAPVVPLAAAAAAAGFLRDALLEAWFRRRGAEPRLLDKPLPAVVSRALERASFATEAGLQSLNLFRWELSRRAARARASRTGHLAPLAAGSMLCAVIGSTAAYFGLAAYFGGWGREAAQPILSGLILLALLIAEGARIVLERLIHRLSESHENSAR